MIIDYIGGGGLPVRCPGTKSEAESEQEQEVESKGGGAMVTGSTVRANTQIERRSTVPPSAPSGHRVGLGVAARSAVGRGGAGLRRGLDRKRKRKLEWESWAVLAGDEGPKVRYKKVRHKKLARQSKP